MSDWSRSDGVWVVYEHDQRDPYPLHVFPGGQFGLEQAHRAIIDTYSYGAIAFWKFDENFKDAIDRAIRPPEKSKQGEVVLGEVVEVTRTKKGTTVRFNLNEIGQEIWDRKWGS